METANNTLDENAEAIANYSTLVTTVANINKQIDADTTELGADDLITKVSGLQNSISGLTEDKENMTKV